MNVRLVKFPDGEDPDIFAQNNSIEELKSYLENESKDFIRFKSEILSKEAKDDPSKIAEMVKEIVKSISLINNLIKQELYIKECSKITGVSEDALFNELNKEVQKNVRKKSSDFKQEVFTKKSATQLEQINPIYVQEENLIKYLMNYGEEKIELNDDKGEPYLTTVANEIIEQLEEDELEPVNEFYNKQYSDIKTQYLESKALDISVFVNSGEEKVSNLAANALSENIELSPNWEKKGVFIRPKEKFTKRLISETILRYKVVMINDKILKIQSSISEEEEERKTSLEKIMRFSKLKNEINNELTRIM